MPSVINQTPTWLSWPAPGFHVFSSSETSLNKNAGNPRANGTRRSPDYRGPRRTIAHRGTEIFVAVGNEVRWSDLCTLRDIGDQQCTSNGSIHTDQDICTTHGYRTLKVAVNEPIRQLIPSPDGSLLAILTTHTAHIAILPDSKHLILPGREPIRTKTYTLGPTTHILSQSQIVSGLWHPLGLGGHCFVTVTVDAILRLWELSLDNRWSFDSPTLAIDLRKLAYATSAEDDTTPAGVRRNRGFSLDGLDMEVASCCFGGSAGQSEMGWASMTLWIAMKEGDIYALCPLLPSRWQCPDSILSSLTSAVVAKASFLQEDRALDEENRRLYLEQYQFVSDIDKQDPILVTGEFDYSPEARRYERPSNPGSLPSLQGPFEILPSAAEEDLELSDIYVVPAKSDSDESGFDDDDPECSRANSIHFSISAICIATKGGRVLVLLDLAGVEARWLSSTRPQVKHIADSPEPRELLLLEALETMMQGQQQSNEWPSFSPDPHSSSSFFLSNSQGIHLLSLSPSLQSLNDEFGNSDGSCSKFRLDVLIKEPRSLRKCILQRRQTNDEITDDYFHPPIVVSDSDLGYFLLTACGNQAQAAVLAEHGVKQFSEPSGEPLDELEDKAELLTLGSPRYPYQPPQSLRDQSSISRLLDTYVQPRHRTSMAEEIRLSASTLDVMTEAHRILSQETHRLGLAASDLFRRCERLKEEFHDQVRQAHETGSRVNAILDDDEAEHEDEYEDSNSDKKKALRYNELSRRLERVKTRQEHLTERYENLKHTTARFGGRDLSHEEKTWMAEINKLLVSVLGSEPLEEEEGEEGEGGDSGDDEWSRRVHQSSGELCRRYEEARDLGARLITNAKDLSSEGDTNVSPFKENGKALIFNDDNDAHSSNTNGANLTTKNGDFKVPIDIRKSRVAKVMHLLERETALVDATQARLRNLSAGIGREVRRAQF